LASRQGFGELKTEQLGGHSQEQQRHRQAPIDDRFAGSADSHALTNVAVCPTLSVKRLSCAQTKDFMQDPLHNLIGCGSGFIVKKSRIYLQTFSHGIHCVQKKRPLLFSCITLRKVTNLK